jgi:hypothetical protein
MLCFYKKPERKSLFHRSITGGGILDKILPAIFMALTHLAGKCIIFKRFCTGPGIT